MPLAVKLALVRLLTEEEVVVGDLVGDNAPQHALVVDVEQAVRDGEVSAACGLSVEMREVNHST